MYIAPRADERQDFLHDGWKLGHTERDSVTPPTDWVDAVMPAMIHLQWHVAGAGEHPYVGENSASYRWMNDRAWWLRKVISGGPGELGPGEHARVVFDGVDHDVTVHVNGERVRDHRGTLGGPVVDITDQLRAGDVELLLRFEPRGTGYGREKGLPGELVKAETFSTWVNNPDLMTTGVWRPVRLVRTAGWTVERPFVWTRSLDEDGAELGIRWETQHAGHEPHLRSVRRHGSLPPVRDPDIGEVHPFAATVEVTITSPLGVVVHEESVPTSIVSQRQWHEIAVAIPNPDVWTVHTIGNAHLYTLSMSLVVADDIVDEVETSFGIRTIEFATSRAARVTDRRSQWLPVLNGEVRRLRGMNWMPLDLLAVAPEKTRWFIERARDAGVELIRVWGGGPTESDEFFDLCDRLGILVMQDFPYNTFFEGHGIDVDLWEDQLVWTVQRLRNHPSLAVWCGGNEFDPYHPANAGVVGVMERTTSDFDGSRTFIRSSTDGGDVHPYPETDSSWYLPLYGEASGVTEWGGHALPSWDSLAEVVSVAELARPITADSLANDEEFRQSHPSMRHHWSEFVPERIPRMTQRAEVFGPVRGCDTGTFIDSTQAGAAEIYETATREFRVFAPDMYIYMPWVYSRPWPSIGMQVIDHSGRPTAGYYAVRRAFGEDCVAIRVDHEALAPGERFAVRVGAVSETDRIAGIRLRMFDSAVRQCHDSQTRPSEHGPEGATITLELPPQERAGVLLVADAVSHTGERVDRVVRWVRVTEAISDDDVRRAYRAAPLPSVVDGITPMSVAIAPHRTQLTCWMEATYDGPAGDDERVVAIIVRNEGPHPAVSARVRVVGAEWIGVADDSEFWLDPDEERRLAVTMRRADSLRAFAQASLETPAPRIEVSAANAAIVAMSAWEEAR